MFQLRLSSFYFIFVAIFTLIVCKQFMSPSYICTISYYNRTFQTLTLCTCIARVDNVEELEAELKCIASWLVASDDIAVHIYYPRTGIGTLEKEFRAALATNFPNYPVSIIGEIPFQQIGEAQGELYSAFFELMETNALTKYVGWINADIVLMPDFYQHFLLAIEYFTGDRGWCLEVPRHNVMPENVPLFNLTTIMDPVKWKAFQPPPAVFHDYGFDVLIYNTKYVTLGDFPPFFMAYAHFEGTLIKYCLKQGQLATLFPAHTSYHLSHPQRPMYVGNHTNPTTAHNVRLFKRLNNGFMDHSWHFPLRLSMEKVCHVTKTDFTCEQHGLHPRQGAIRSYMSNVEYLNETVIT